MPSEHKTSPITVYKLDKFEGVDQMSLTSQVKKLKSKKGSGPNHEVTSDIGSRDSRGSNRPKQGSRVGKYGKGRSSIDYQTKVYKVEQTDPRRKSDAEDEAFEN